VIPWDRFRATVAEASALARSEEFDPYQAQGHGRSIFGQIFERSVNWAVQTASV